MPIITVTSNNRIWYMIGTIIFLVLGVSLIIGGFFLAWGITWGITGIVVTIASVILLIDAIRN